jgi:Tol biopolymer transport system component/DNA-binding winged helix-turn-helix (wHTH) protein
VYRFDNISVDPANHRVSKGGDPRPLEPKSFRLLLFLIEHRDRAVTKEEILENIWRDTFVTDNALTRAIGQIRKALDDDTKQPRYIETVPTVGYRFVGTLEESQTVSPVRPSRRWGARHWTIFATSAAITALGLTAIVLKGRAPRAPIFQARQFSTSDGLDVCPSFSPDGNLIAYASDRGGPFQVFVRSRDPNAKELQLTRDDNQNLGPVFSPDGRWIAYYSLAQPGIYRVPALGGPAQKLSNFGVQPVWSPDGKWIVFPSFGGGSMSTTDSYWPQHSTLWLIASEGGQPKQITTTANPVGGQQWPSWSPDGKEIRFVNKYNNESNLWSYRLADGARRKLFAFRFELGGPVFSPDQRSMYYVTWRLNGDIAIWRLPLDPEKLQPAGEAQPVYIPVVGVPRDLALTADGKHLSFSIILSESKILLAQTPDGKTISGEPKPVTHEVGFRYAQPTLSKDGGLVAYTLWRKGRNAAVMVSKTDGSDSWMVEPETEGHYYPYFAPDDQWVSYFADWGPRKGGIKRTRISDRETVTTAAVDGGTGGSVAFSPDGARILVNDIAGPEMALIARDLSTGAVTRLAAKQGFDIGYGHYSPDEKWISVDFQPPGNSMVGVVPAQGGEPEVLLEKPGLAYPYGWASDSNRILFAGRYDGIWNVYWISRISRHVEQLTHYSALRTYVRYPSWSADSRRLVFEFNESKGNVFVADVQ